MNLAIFLKKAASVARNQHAIAVGTKNVITFGALERRVASLAQNMRQRLGLKSGNRVALVLPNCPEYIEVLFACWWCGLVAVPINAKLNPREIEYIFENAKPRVCFTTPSIAKNICYEKTELILIGSKKYQTFLRGVGIELMSVSPDDLAWLFYTSGTTGKPKGAMLSHRNLITMSACFFMNVDQIEPSDSIIHAAPMSHGSGLYIIPFMSAMALQVIPESQGFEPKELFELFHFHKGICLFAAPTMVRRLVSCSASKIGPGNLKSIIYGGGPMYTEDCKSAMKALGNRLIQIYGQGESPMTITVLTKFHHADKQNPNYENHIASVGIPQSLVDVRVMREDNSIAAIGETGEIRVRGDTVMMGYWQDTRATEEKIVNSWLYTGDMGFIDSEGFITLQDRKSDLVISGGSNIYPREIEEILILHPGVKECAVIGKPDPDWGETVIAFIVPHFNLNPKELDSLCLEMLARFKRPKQYNFVETLPKNNYGKILKKELRKLTTQT